ncbi:MAG: glycosyltransferase family 39 protein [Flavobacteriales bacterium]|nr:glycosyltransferase family 39 protein [Flavobacteriales bacterium]
MRSKNLSIALIPLLTIVYVLMSNWNGVSVPTGDSYSFYSPAMQIARNSLCEDVFTALDEKGELVDIGSRKNFIRAPGIAYLFGSLLALGLPIKTSGIILNLLLVLAVLLLLYRWADIILKNKTLSLIISTHLIFSWVFYIWCVRSYMSESLFIAYAIFLAVFFEKSYHKISGRTVYLILSGILCGLVYYTKYSGLALLPVIAFFPLLRQKKLTVALKDAILLVVGMCISVIPWMYRNYYLNGSIGGGGSGYSSRTIPESTMGLIRIFVPKHGSFQNDTLTLIFLGVFVLVGTVVLFILLKNVRVKDVIRYVQKADSAVLFSLLYLTSYLALTLVGIYIIPKTHHIESRYWMEIYPFFMPLLIKFTKDASSINGISNGLVRKGFVVLLIVSMAANIKEVYRNRSKFEITMKNESERELLRSEIAKLLPSKGRYIFTSNKFVRMYVETGITDWSEIDTSSVYDEYKIDPKLIYALYDHEQDESIILSDIPTSPPSNYSFLGKVQNMKLYMHRNTGNVE